MHHGRHRGFGPRGPWHGRRLGQRWYERENVVERLEEYQRDLEQELADVSDLLKRLKEEQAETASV